MCCIDPYSCQRLRNTKKDSSWNDWVHIVCKYTKRLARRFLKTDVVVTTASKVIENYRMKEFC